MTMKHTPGPVFISPDQVLELNEKHGWFEFGDGQSDVSNAFANDAIARYERIRSAAPELLAQAEKHLAWLSNLTDWAGADDPDLDGLRAAIAKARGAQ